MSTSLRMLVGVAMVAGVFAAGGALAAEPASGQKDLNDFACKDVMRLSGSERENALALVHGYRLGKMNTTKYEIDKLAAITDSFIEHCLNNPNDKALAAFEKIGK